MTAVLFLALGIALVGLFGLVLMALGWRGGVRRSGLWFALGAFIVFAAICAGAALAYAWLMVRTFPH